MVKRLHVASILFCLSCITQRCFAQPCLGSYVFTQNPMPVAGVYQAGQTVSFCFTITFWNTTNANWFHGMVPSFGPGWDVSTFVPGPPPATCQAGGGLWGYYPICTGTAITAIGPVGPGWFFDANNDGIPGNNFGDFCAGPVNWQFCWDITVSSTINCVNGADLSIVVETYGDSETGSWGGAGCTGDAVAPSATAIAECCNANAGTAGAISLCSNGAITSLFGLLGGTPDPGGAWTDPGGNTHSGSLDPAIDPSGAYTYIVTSLAPPCSSVAVVNVSIATQPDAGPDASTIVCSSDPAFGLSTLLGANAGAGGTWTDAFGNVVPGIFDPAVDPGGTFTYSLIGAPPCTTDAAAITVSVSAALSAGTNGSTTVCSTDPPFDLFALLGGSPDPGGNWTIGGAATNNIFTPGTSTPGIFTYTLSPPFPCAPQAAAVTVSVSANANAGADNTITLCNTNAPVVLIAQLLGAPDPGGAWTDPNGVAFGATLTPGTALSGAYTYTVGIAPCPVDQATLTVNINQQPDAGGNASISVCTGSAPFDMFALLTGTPDPGGSWMDPNNSPVSSLFDPAVSIPGAYTYEIQGNAPCLDASATVSVAVNPAPDAGVASTVLICSSDAPFALISSLGGSPQPGGSWTDPNGLAYNGTFIPGSSADGVYTYTIAGIAPCLGASATVTITTTTAADAGINNMVTLCNTSAPIDLYTQLGGTPDAGGFWTDPNGNAFLTLFDPATSPAGSYLYTITASPPCSDASASVTVVVNAQPDAGSNGSFTICSSGAPSSLFAQLGGSPDPGGSWTDPNNAACTGTYSPGISIPGTYAYTLNGIAPCGTASASVLVIEQPGVDAGTNGAIVLCENGAPYDPFTALGGSPDAGGTWTDPNGNNISVPIDPSTALVGSYTDTVAGTTPCPSAVADVALSIDNLPNAGGDNAVMLCIDDLPLSLSTLLDAMADPGGTWTSPGGGVFNGDFDPSLDPIGQYAYTVAGTGACAGNSDVALIDAGTYPMLPIAFTLGPSMGCAPLVVDIQGVFDASLVVGAAWTFGDGSTGSGNDVQHTYTQQGLFAVELTVTDMNGCITTSIQPGAVIVTPPPSALFIIDPQPASTNNPLVNFNALESGHYQFAWTINGDTASGISTTYFFPIGIGNAYDVCLTVTDTAYGCESTFCDQAIVDDDLDVFVPNAFTPDGDGTNDLFLPMLVGAVPEDFTLSIFDRWGSVVFSSTILGEAWNGGFLNSGEALKEDVYVWRIKAHDRFTALRKEWIGHVTLLK
ncbi:MAG: gliding motility-associated C-terminal domain-containing protein [Flavobacteriales bacterium]|nr:gliding motility-associated C-terminal domain-containing protein [Flavobacteriales bacterium]